jgi:hypothetical protein
VGIARIEVSDVDVCLSFTLVFIPPTIIATPRLLTVGEDGVSVSLNRPPNFRRAENILETSFIPIRKSSSPLPVRSGPSERRPQFTIPATCVAWFSSRILERLPSPETSVVITTT